MYLLKRWLEASGHRVFFTEWNSSDLIKPTTKKAKKERALTPTTFSLIHACDFADRYERLILPHLQAGYLVLADRYIYTAFARDAVRGCDFDWIRKVYGFAVQPDLTFYFQAPLEVSLDRILSGRPELKYHEAGMDLSLSKDPEESFKLFQGLIKAEYDLMASRYGFVVMDATRPISEQQREMRAIVARTIADYQHPSHANRAAVDLAVNSRPLRLAAVRSPVLSEVENPMAASEEQKTAAHV